jgi:hypothetical protein
MVNILVPHQYHAVLRRCLYWLPFAHLSPLAIWWEWLGFVMLPRPPYHCLLSKGSCAEIGNVNAALPHVAVVAQHLEVFGV